MNLSDKQVSAAVAEAVKQGKIIEAIKLLRAETGLGLAEAKDVVERFQRGEASSSALPSSHSFDPNAGMPADVIAALRAGRKVSAIKLLRAARGIGLKEAKETVEAYAEQAGIQSSAAQSGNGLLGVVAIALIGLAYYFFTRQ